MSYMEVQDQLVLFYWMRLGAGLFVVVAGLLFIYSIFGPVKEESPAHLALQLQPAE